MRALSELEEPVTGAYAGDLDVLDYGGAEEAEAGEFGTVWVGKCKFVDVADAGAVCWWSAYDVRDRVQETDAEGRR